MSRAHFLLHSFSFFRLFFRVALVLSRLNFSCLITSASFRPKSVDYSIGRLSISFSTPKSMVSALLAVVALTVSLFLASSVFHQPSHLWPASSTPLTGHGTGHALLSCRLCLMAP